MSSKNRKVVYRSADREYAHGEAQAQQEEEVVAPQVVGGPGNTGASAGPTRTT